MNLLYLTREEKTLFDALPEDLREGWKVEDLPRMYQSELSEKRIRIELLRVRSPNLLSFRDKAKNAQSDEELLSLAKDIDISKVSEADLAQLFYALGPEGVSALIGEYLSEVKSDGDLAQIAALAELRNDLISSLAEAAANAAR